MRLDVFANRHFGSHLNVSDVTFGGEIHPIRLIQLGPDHIVEVRNLVVLSDKSSYMSLVHPGNGAHDQDNVTCEPQLRMSLDCRNDSTEHCGRHDMDFVQKDEAPLARCQELHHLL